MKALIGKYQKATIKKLKETDSEVSDLKGMEVWGRGWLGRAVMIWLSGLFRTTRLQVCEVTETLYSIFLKKKKSHGLVPLKGLLWEKV